MDDFSEKMTRAFTIFKFLLFGPVILLISVPVDTFVFYYNLYTEPPVEVEDNAPALSLEVLEVFEVCLSETLKIRRDTSEKKSGTEVNFIALNQAL